MKMLRLFPRSMAYPSLKAQHELAIAKALLAAISERGDFLRFGVGGIEPDVVYRIASQVVGIEVATAYYAEIYRCEHSAVWA
jgi:hypothetical protein